MIPQETVQLILDTARVEDVVGDFVTLKRRGSSLWACCPFHNEKTPSFHVEPSRGIYKCFGCGKSGTAVGFVMEYEKLSYTEALKYLARKYHIEVKEKEESAEDIAARQRNESLLAVSEFAFDFYKDQLATDEGRAVAVQYFHSRGLEDETIAKYGLGWAPKSKNALTEAAKKEGYKDEYLLETGLCAQWDTDGSLHDRFYDRVMFPIHSVSGRVIAFGGRTLFTDKSVAKYVNSKESEIYVKSRSLYGIYFAKSAISRADKCYLVEGYLDVLSMHQLGITNVVASSGTSLTVEQIRLIKRFTENVTIMYDGDPAGIHAALRGIDLILKEGMNVKVVLIPDGDDPDSYARKHTLEEVEAFIAANEQDFIAFKADLLLGEAGNDPLKRANLINDIADSVAGIPDAVKRSVYTDAISAKFRIDTDILTDRVRRTREKIQGEERTQAQREAIRARREEDVPRTQEATYTPPVNELRALETQSPILAPSERELLRFILMDGSTPLVFESDSEFYSESPQTVAEFIDTALAGDGIVFANDAYQRTYEAYFALYDAGKEQDEIVRDLLNGPDDAVRFVVSQLSGDKYELTVKNFQAALTTRDSWLTNFVPKAILAYHIKRLQADQTSLTRELATAGPDRQRELFTTLERINELKKRINIKLGRLK
uniref:DNA primase n=1 Tax=uncultured bacterium URE4 TaxID=581112 RepID=C0JZY3_9BACT|nr:DNA primase [uncultured bacterium URE4]